jgi:hypothetical protein
VKSVFFAAVLVAALIPMAAAQDSKSQPASLAEKVQVQGTAPVMSRDWQPVHVPKAPAYCKPCYFYSGDFNSSNSKANGLANEDDQLVADSHLYSPFKVSSKGATVSGLFVNSLDGVGAIDNPTPWAINKGVKVGSGGRVVAHGTSKSTDAPTGRSGFGLTEYTHLVKFKARALKAGTYWENVTPQCLTGSSCGSARYFESDEQDDPKPINHVGAKNILDDSFWNSTSFGQNWTQVNGTQGCGGIGCDMFSAGVLGK